MVAGESLNAAAPHDSVVVGEGQEEAASEAVAVDGRHGGHARNEEMRQQGHVPEIPTMSH